MDCFEKFKRKMQLSGGSLRKEFVKNNTKLLEYTFGDDSSIQDGMYIWEVNHLDKEYYIENDDVHELSIRLYDRKFSNANGTTVQFHTLMGDKIEVGYILYHTEYDEFFICTEAFNIDNIHYEGKLTKCNYVLKWQNDTGKIFEYPCYDINATQYNSGETSNANFTIGSSQHMLTLPRDENTIVLNSPKRFYLDNNLEDPTVYIVTQNDNTSYNYGKGLIKLTCMENVEISGNDRPDLMLCDYIDVDNLPSEDEPVSGIKSSILYYSNIIKSGGNRKKFTANFTDNNEVVDITPVWNIVCDFKDYLDIVISDNTISIGINNDDYVDEAFLLELSNENGEYYSSITVYIESMI